MSFSEDKCLWHCATGCEKRPEQMRGKRKTHKLSGVKTHTKTNNFEKKTQVFHIR